MNSRDLDPIITQQYILQMRPVFDKDALFSDGSKYYRIPMEPEIGEEVKIRFRTLRNNVDNVYLILSQGNLRRVVIKTLIRPADIHLRSLMVMN